ncbi:MAG: tripartite tricarboxylate transporter substrate binding protein [Burkholderiaceae bacterium]|nr:tripartite tricarboxylate transporter substrate binding protein [Burkholderiaceae bacterium]
MLACAAGALALQTGPAWAQDPAYPSKPIRFIVPFAPGGPADSISRLLGARLQEQLGQTIVVDNIPGAGSTLGTARLAKMPADGCAIGFAHSGSMSIGPSLNKNVGYDPSRDLTPIARVTPYVNLLVVRADSPYRTIGDLITDAKARPGVLTYGSAGIGSSNHLSGELFAAKAGASMTHVPYKGSALAMNDMLGGNLSFMFDAPNTTTQLVKAGKVRVLATTGASRHPKFPDAPAIAESLLGYEFKGWMGVVAPRGLPATVQERLTAEAKKALAAPDMSVQLETFGMDVAFGDPAELTRTLTTELQLVGPLIKSLGLKVE